MTRYRDLACSGFIHAGDLFHDLARGLGQLGRSGREGAASSNSDDNLVFLTVDSNESLTDFLTKGDLQFILCDLGLFVGLLLLLSFRLLLLGICAVRLDGGLGGGGKLGQFLLKPAEQHFLIGLAGGFLRLLDGFECLLKEIRQFVVLGFGRGEVHHDILAKNLDLDIAAGDGILQRLDDLFGGL